MKILFVAVFIFNISFYMNAQSNSVAPLIQTEWHQEMPYNDDAPVWNFILPNKFSKKTSAGCGAIVVAQLMRYYEWPSLFKQA